MYPIQPDPDSNDVIDMFLARGERWKRLRTIVNPTFSNAKMKQVRHIRKGSFISILRAIYQRDRRIFYFCNIYLHKRLAINLR